jgi:hypothetical protein
LARGLVDVSTQSVAPPTTAETGVKIVVPVDYTPPPKLATSTSPPQPISDAASGGGYGTRYYTYKAQVPLKPGQTIGFTPGRGYYAYYPTGGTTQGGAGGGGSGNAGVTTGGGGNTGKVGSGDHSSGANTRNKKPLRSLADAEPIIPQRAKSTLSGHAKSVPTVPAAKPRALRPLLTNSPLPPIPKPTAAWNSNSGRERTAYDYLSSQLSPPLKNYQVAALIGNMVVESDDYLSKTLPHPVLLPTLNEVGGAGYGIAQWTNPDRVEGLHAFAADNHTPVNTFGVQLAYVAVELRTGGAYQLNGKEDYTLKTTKVLSELAQTPDLTSAVNYIMNNYESPQGGSEKRRRAAAKSVLQRFG